MAAAAASSLQQHEHHKDEPQLLRISDCVSVAVPSPPSFCSLLWRVPSSGGEVAACRWSSDARSGCDTQTPRTFSKLHLPQF